MTRVALLLLAICIALPATAGDYPTTPDEMDKLCEVIGEAPNLSVPPKDRLWFKENCFCVASICGRTGSNRFTARIEVEAKKLEAENNRRQAEARTAAEAARVAAVAARQKVVADCKPFEDCLRANVGTPKLCKDVAVTFEYKCSSAIRDMDTCGDAIRALVAEPTATCATVLK